MISVWSKRASWHSLKEDQFNMSKQQGSKEVGRFKEHNYFLAPRWHILLFIHISRHLLSIKFSSVKFECYTELLLFVHIRCLTARWFNHQCSNYYMLESTQQYCPTGHQNCCCYLPVQWSVSQFNYVSMMWQAYWAIMACALPSSPSPSSRGLVHLISVSGER
jgi:hypothetical protein